MISLELNFYFKSPSFSPITMIVTFVGIKTSFLILLMNFDFSTIETIIPPSERQIKGN